MELSEQQRELKESVSVLARRKLAPRAAEYDLTGRFPRESLDDLAAEGLLGLLVPRELGGLGADLLSFSLVIEEIAKGCGSTALIFAMHCGATKCVAVGGTSEQKQRYLKPVVGEGKLFAWGFSEPGTGGNILRPQLKTLQRGDDFVLNGTKSFCTGAGHVDFYLINAQAEADRGFARSQHFFVLEPGMAGFSVREVWDSLGMRANCSNDLLLEEAVAPAATCIGGPGGGLQILAQAASPLILGLAATSLGVAAAAQAFARDHVGKRTLAPTGSTLADFQAVRFMVAEMAIMEHTARLALHHASQVAEKDSLEALVPMNIAKYVCNKNAIDIASTAMQLCGGRGYQRKFPLERHFRDSRAGAVMGANLEALRDMIGKASLGMDPLRLEEKVTT